MKIKQTAARSGDRANNKQRAKRPRYYRVQHISRHGTAMDCDKPCHRLYDLWFERTAWNGKTYLSAQRFEQDKKTIR